jgi:hypothetical protein
MQDDDLERESRRAERHIESAERGASEGAHVEGFDYEDDTVEGALPEPNLEPQDPNSTDEGAPLEALEDLETRDGDRYLTLIIQIRGVIVPGDPERMRDT